MKDTGNHCPRPGCGVMIRAGLPACRRDWYALPRGIREAINANYTPGQTIYTATAEYRRINQTAMDWFRDNPLPEDPDPL